MPSLQPLFFKFFFWKSTHIFFSGGQNQDGAHRRRQTRINIFLIGIFLPALISFLSRGQVHLKSRQGGPGCLDSQRWDGKGVSGGRFLICIYIACPRITGTSFWWLKVVCSFLEQHPKFFLPFLYIVHRAVSKRTVIFSLLKRGGRVGQKRRNK